MTHDHSHTGRGAQARGGARYKSRLKWSLLLVLGFFVVEVVAGVATKSLALISDAGHMLTDVLGLGMALAAIHLANAGSVRRQRTFGLYRLEILAALANGVLLFGVAIYVLVEAARRLSDPPDISSLPMLIVAGLGLAVNLVAFALLRSGAEESLNVKGAYLEVMSDAIGSVGVIVAALVLRVTGWPYADPIVAAAIGLFILPRTYRLTAQAVRILIQAAPPNIDLKKVESDLQAIEGVLDVHDLHLWTLTSEMEVASAHLRVADGSDAPTVLDRAQTLLKERYDVVHSTLQIESEFTECYELGGCLN
ncbi:MAG: cation diffusion facilitator family transporter [Actinomycetota bacterium]